MTGASDTGVFILQSLETHSLQSGDLHFTNCQTTSTNWLNLCKALIHLDFFVEICFHFEIKDFFLKFLVKKKKKKDYIDHDALKGKKHPKGGCTVTSAQPLILFAHLHS